MAKKQSKLLISVDKVEQLILLVRAQRVMLDADLAELYGVELRTLNQAVKRNLARFPSDFVFQLAGTNGRRSTTLRSTRVEPRRRRPL